MKTEVVRRALTTEGMACIKHKDIIQFHFFFLEKDERKRYIHRTKRREAIMIT